MPLRRSRKISWILSLRAGWSRYYYNKKAESAEHLHRDIDLTPSKSFLRVVTKAWNIVGFLAFGPVAVEGSLEPVLEVVDHDLFDISVDSIPFTFEILLAIEEIVEQLSESLV